MYNYGYVKTGGNGGSGLTPEQLKDLEDLKTGYLGEVYDSPQARFLDEFKYLSNVDYIQKSLTASNPTVSNTVYGKTGSLGVVGGTLQNLSEPLDDSLFEVDTGTLTNDGDVYTLTKIPSETPAHCYMKLYPNNWAKMLKPNTEYTLYIPNYSNTGSYKNFVIADVDSDEVVVGSGTITKDGTCVFTTAETIDYTHNFNFVLYVTDTNTDSGTLTFNKNISLFEGNIPLANIPNGYFEGIQSVGQLQEDGTYKVAYKSIPFVNILFDLDDFMTAKNSAYYSVVNGNLQVNVLDIRSTMDEFDYFIPVKPNTSYWFSSSCTNLRVFGFDSSGIKVDLIATEGINTFTTTGTNITKVVVKFVSATPLTVTDIILTEGTSKPPVSYQEDIREYYLSEPLRMVGNNCDYILNGKYVRKIGKYTFTGDEQITIPDWGSELPNTFGFEIPFDIVEDYILCNRLPCFDITNVTTRDFPHIMPSKLNEAVAVKVWRSELESLDVEGVRKWLKTNELSFYYVLSNPVSVDIEPDMRVKSYEGNTTIVSVNSNVKPSFFVSIPCNVTTIITQLEEENAKLQEELDTTALALAELYETMLP